MRPIKRGELPIDPNTQLPIVFIEYGQARGHLLVRIGNYCSYCERELSHSIAIEHIQPKSLEPTLENSWDNFLIACVNCNSSKKNKIIVLNEYFWPDIDNTFNAFLYSEEGIIRINVALQENERLKAEKTLKLTGLNKIPSENLIENPEQSDQRWIQRRDVWGMAIEEKDELLKYLTIGNVEGFKVHLKCLIKLAVAKGFWSIWMTVFKDFKEIKLKLIEAFVGTSRECFDENFNSVFRQGGSL